MPRRLTALALLVVALSLPAAGGDLPLLFEDDFSKGAGRWKPTDAKAFIAWLETIKFEHTGTQQTFEDYKAEAIHHTTRLARLEQQITEAIATAQNTAAMSLARYKPNQAVPRNDTTASASKTTINTTTVPGTFHHSPPDAKRRKPARK